MAFVIREMDTYNPDHIPNPLDGPYFYTLPVAFTLQWSIEVSDIWDHIDVLAGMSVDGGYYSQNGENWWL